MNLCECGCNLNLPVLHEPFCKSSYKCIYCNANEFILDQIHNRGCPSCKRCEYCDKIISNMDYHDINCPIYLTKLDILRLVGGNYIDKTRYFTNNLDELILYKLEMEMSNVNIILKTGVIEECCNCCSRFNITILECGHELCLECEKELMDCIFCGNKINKNI